MEEFAHILPLVLPKGEPYRQKTVYKVQNDDEWEESEYDTDPEETP